MTSTPRQTALDSVRANERLEGTYLVRSKTSALDKNGRRYLTLSLADTTGEIEARVWDSADTVDALAVPGGILDITGTITEFMGRLQLKVDEARATPPGGLTAADLAPRSAHSTAELTAAFDAATTNLAHAGHAALVAALRGHPEFWPLYASVPASTGMHYAFTGGLLEHVASMLRAVPRLVKLYPGLDAGILTLGIVFGPAGAVRAFDPAAGNQPTLQAVLVGPAALGMDLVTTLAREIPGLDAGITAEICHMIAVLAPPPANRPPMTLEATALLHLAGIDRDTNYFARVAKSARGAAWTQYDPHFSSYLLTQPLEAVTGSYERALHPLLSAIPMPPRPETQLRKREPPPAAEIRQQSLTFNPFAEALAGTRGKPGRE